MSKCLPINTYTFLNRCQCTISAICANGTDNVYSRLFFTKPPMPSRFPPSSNRCRLLVLQCIRKVGSLIKFVFNFYESILVSKYKPILACFKTIHVCKTRFVTCALGIAVKLINIESEM